MFSNAEYAAGYAAGEKSGQESAPDSAAPMFRNGWAAGYAFASGRQDLRDRQDGERDGRARKIDHERYQRSAGYRAEVKRNGGL